jgi:translation elongation factor EF-Tu-like GTPase
VQDYPKDFEVEMTFLRTEEGGRSTPAYSNYRPQFYYAGNDYGATFTLIETESANPGQTVRAYLCVSAPDFLFGRIEENAEFLVREGSRIVAKGRILKILELEKNALEVAKRKAQKSA